MDQLSKMLLAQAIKTVTRILQGDKGKDPAMDRLLEMAMAADPATIKIVEQTSPFPSMRPDLPHKRTVVTFKGKDEAMRTIVIF